MVQGAASSTYLFLCMKYRFYYVKLLLTKSNDGYYKKLVLRLAHRLSQFLVVCAPGQHVHMAGNKPVASGGRALAAAAAAAALSMHATSCCSRATAYHALPH
jgi:hypothetical protein